MVEFVGKVVFAVLDSYQSLFNILNSDIENQSGMPYLAIPARQAGGAGDASGDGERSGGGGSGGSTDGDSSSDTDSGGDNSQTETRKGSLTLRRGAAASAEYWYDVTGSGFAAGQRVTVACHDSADSSFYSQTLTADSSGGFRDQTLCFSGDGPDHWVTAGTGALSNTIKWTKPAPDPDPDPTTTPAPEPDPTGTLSLRQGAAASAGYWYDLAGSGFKAGQSVTVYCNDSVDSKFWTQTFTANSSGAFRDTTLCYSGDGPDHWVTSSTGARSNTVKWTKPAPEPDPTGTLSLRQGAAASAGYWYDLAGSGFNAGQSVTVYCNDSVDSKFWTQTFTANSSGAFRDTTLCYSGDGPDHWVTSSTGARSNTVKWN